MIENKIPILIVLYDPEISVINRIKNINGNLFIYDNSKYINNDFSGIEYFHSNENRGIVGSLLWMIDLCKKFGYEKFIFFDQDTIFTSDVISAAQNFSSSDNEIFKIHHLTSENKKIENVKFVINSGTIFDVNFLLNNKKILNKYFVDAIDLMLSYICRYTGYKIRLSIIPGIDHFSEQGAELWKLFGFTFLLKDYSILRRKEFYRSHLRLLKMMAFNLSLIDALTILKFIISFVLIQAKVDLVKNYGRKL